MAPRIAQDGDHQVRRPVDHLGLVRKIGCRIHKAHEFHKPRQAAPIPAAGLVRLRKKAQRAALCRTGSGLNIQIGPKLARDKAAIRRLRDLARDMQQAAHLDKRHIVGRRRRGVRQGQAKLGKAGINTHGKSSRL